MAPTTERTAIARPWTVPEKGPQVKLDCILNIPMV
jgi:hypothetical protein